MGMRRGKDRRILDIRWAIGPALLRVRTPRYDDAIWKSGGARQHAGTFKGGCAGESWTRLGRVVVEDVSTAVAAQ